MVQKFDVEDGESSGGGLRLSQNVIAVLILISIAFIFTVGMLSGFVFRKINVCEPVYSLPSQGDTTRPTQPPMTGGSTGNPQTQDQTTPTRSSFVVTNATTAEPSRSVPTLSTLTTTTTAQSNEIYDNIRLPTIFEPTNYNLKIKVDFDPSARNDGTSFEGEVDIYFNLKNMTKEILFHAGPHLKVLDPIIITNLGTNEEINTSQNEHRPVKNDYFYINLPKIIVAGSYKMRVNYEGDYASLYGNRGIFAAKYLDDLVERTYVATAFLPNEARRVFPCFDEPHLKATFDIEIDHPLKTIALSNAEVDTSVQVPDLGKPYLKTTFKKSAKLNTASLGWVILPDLFQSEQVTTINGRPVRLFAKRVAKENGLLSHALEVASKSIDFFERDYLGVSEAVLPKIDLIALADFPYETMELWGLSIFRESSILYSSKTDAPITKQRTALLVAEQMAHLWFGNLVSCGWWDDLWFNKAAAGWLKYKAVQSIFKDWGILDQFIVEETIPIMWEDGYASSHPLQVKLQTTADIISVLDKVTTSKGAAVMRTVESVVGSDQFRQGLTNYLNKNKASGVGVIADFFQNFKLPSEMSSTNPGRWISSWTQQMNYPIVEVSLRRNGGNTIFDFIQDRFLLTVIDEEQDPLYTSPFGYLWQIYVRCKAGGVYSATGDEQQHLQGSIDDIIVFLDKQSASVTKTNRQYTWIKCNQGFESYYTTSYSKIIFEGFIDVLRIKPETFEIADRANLLHISYQTAYRGDTGYSTPSALSSYLSFKEKDYVPWKVFIYHINLIAGLLEHRPVFKSLAIFGESIVESLSADLDFYSTTNNPNKPHLQSLLEASAVEFLCRLQEEDCLQKTSELFAKIPSLYFDKPSEVDNPVPANIRASVYKYHLQNTYNYNDWFDVYQLYELAYDAQEKQIALNSLSSSRSTWLLTTHLLELLNPETQIRKEDFFEVVNAVSRNPSGRHLAWYFYRHYYDDIVSKFTILDYEFGQSIKAISETFSDIYFLQEMWDFFYAHPVVGSQEFSRLQAIDVAESNLLWINDKEEDVADNLLGPLKKI